VANDPSEVLGRRIGAALIDILILALIFVAIGVASGGGNSDDGTVSVHTGTAGTLVFFAVELAYYFFQEAATGQTVGKRLLGIRVAAADGTPATRRQVAIRTLLRLVDILPALYLLGLVVALAGGERRQRIGDLAARTVVVKA
jgi:uncharacterized RDD family membrane protein YckC